MKYIYFTSACALLVFFNSEYDVSAAQLLIPQTTWVNGTVSLNGQTSYKAFAAPNPGVNSLSARVTSPSWNSLAHSAASANFSNSTNNLLSMNLHTDAYADTITRNAWDEVRTSTISANGGWTGMPINIRPESIYGDKIGQPVLITLSATYRGLGTSAANGGYNQAIVQYAAAATNWQWTYFVRQKENQFDGRTSSVTRQFSAKMGDSFWIAPLLQSYAPLKGAEAYLDLSIRVQRTSSLGFASYSVPEPASVGLLLAAIPAMSLSLRRRALRNDLH